MVAQYQGSGKAKIQQAADRWNEAETIWRTHGRRIQQATGERLLSNPPGLRATLRVGPEYALSRPSLWLDLQLVERNAMGGWKEEPVAVRNIVNSPAGTQMLKKAAGGRPIIFISAK